MKASYRVRALLACSVLVLGCGDTQESAPDSGQADGLVGGDGPRVDRGADGSAADGKYRDTTPGDGAAAGEWVALVRGKPASLTGLKAAHDALAKGGEAQAKAAGNFAHDPLLSTTDLGGTADFFASIDRWSQVAGLAFYENATFKAGLASLFDGGSYQVEKFERKTGWKGWGSLDAADATTPHYVVVVRGKLKSSFANAAAAQAAHDPVAAGGEAAAKALGDVAHMAYLGTTDWREFLGIDVWTDSSKLAQLYNDASFKAGFAALFEDPTQVKLTVYKSTDLHTW